jgi:hypothetical protein
MKLKLMVFCLLNVALLNASPVTSSSEYIITTKHNKAYVWKIKTLEENKTIQDSKPYDSDSFWSYSGRNLDTYRAHAEVKLNDAITEVSITSDNKYFTTISKNESKVWRIDGILLANLIMK